MKRVVLGLAVAAVAVAFAPQASAETCINHPRTPYPIICLSPR